MPPKAMPWFRMYVETFTDIEVRALPIAQRWVWGAFMAMARMSPVPGVLLDKAGRPASEAMLAEFAGASVSQVRALVKRFTEIGSLERNDDGALVLRNWDRRQFESDNVTARTAKHRARNGQGNDDGTFQRTPDGTFPPSVRPREPEEQRREPPPPTSAEPPAEPDPGGGDLFDQAARLVAEPGRLHPGTDPGDPP
jgi:hypothetical protein